MSAPGVGLKVVEGVHEQETLAPLVFGYIVGEIEPS